MARPTTHDLQTILQIVNDNPGLSNRQHAKLLGVSEGTVRRAKKRAGNPVHKQHVFLSDPQLAQLKAEAERLGMSVSELIRRMIDSYFEK